jgi:hypothetical protein
MSQTIQGLKRLALAAFENPRGARHPVHALAVHQMPNHFSRAPGPFAFIPQRKLLRLIAQKRIQHRRKSSKKRKREL